MANRLTKIYTRTGDDGTTGKADGSRVAKDDGLIAFATETQALAAIAGRLEWDQETMMPRGAAEQRVQCRGVTPSWLPRALDVRLDAASDPGEYSCH